MKYLNAALMICVLLLGGALLLEKGGDFLNGPPPTDVQRDSLGKRFVRALTNWMIDKGMRDKPPKEQPPKAMAIYSPPVDEMLLKEGDELKHGEGW